MKSVKMLLIATMLLISLMGCAADRKAATNTESPGNPGNEADVTEIEFGFIGTNTYYDQFLEEYYKTQSKVRVKPVSMGANYDELTEQLQTKAVANKMPDIITSGFNYSQFYIDNFQITPIQTFIDKEKYDLSDFYPNMLELGKGNDGKLYGLPFGVSTTILYINEDMFRTANLDPGQLPQTWDELRNTAKLLTKGDQHGIYIDYVSGTGNFTFQAFLETAGGNMLKDSKQVSFNSAAGRRSLQLLYDLQSVDKSMPNLTRNQADQSFQAGKIAMYVMAGSRLSSFNQKTTFKLKTAVFPSASGKTRKVPAGGNSLLILSKDSKKQAAAWDFIKFASSPKGTSLWAQATGYMAVRKSAVDTPDLMGDYLKKNPNARVTYDQVGDVVPWSSFPGSNGYRIDSLLKDKILAAAQGQITVEQALKDAETQANDLLK